MKTRWPIDVWKFGHIEHPTFWSMQRLIQLDVPYDATHAMLDRHFAVMALCPQHWFVVIGNAGRMAEYMDDYCGSQTREDLVHEELAFSVKEMNAWDHAKRLGGKWQEPQIDGEGRTELDGYWDGAMFPWPLPNVTQACRIRTQADADRDLPQLIRCPAVERWVYVEPGEAIRFNMAVHPTYGNIMTDPLTGFELDIDDESSEPNNGGTESCIHGVTVTGGDIAHARSLRDQCRAAGVKFACDRPIDGVEHGNRPGEGR